MLTAPIRAALRIAAVNQFIDIEKEQVHFTLYDGRREIAGFVNGSIALIPALACRTTANLLLTGACSGSLEATKHRLQKGASPGVSINFYPWLSPYQLNSDTLECPFKLTKPAGLEFPGLLQDVGMRYNGYCAIGLGDGKLQGCLSRLGPIADHPRPEYGVAIIAGDHGVGVAGAAVARQRVDEDELTQ
jgi:hypothetical protein